ncbi:hypothetical protein SEA_JUMBO_101 [Gordonia phage Jumbo]|uniref:Uncharacterized protein n=1 Tax=Gordonia phage Jumbo TaxID=1887650 RepID=A0A1B3B0Y6_9CAUD|nr:hypothetical protein BIZ69_gp101 [Gordonia phage Jumbo]AOE44608.1 hypothetical protein SEA_JUMBO_101 [Gordonia phage Jumbo]
MSTYRTGRHSTTAAAEFRRNLETAAMISAAPVSLKKGAHRRLEIAPGHATRHVHVGYDGTLWKYNQTSQRWQGFRPAVPVRSRVFMGK